MMATLKKDNQGTSMQEVNISASRRKRMNNAVGTE
jgi:hypothetical protein